MIPVMGEQDAAGSSGQSLLGLATTRELLRELEVRGAVGVLDERFARHREALRALEHMAARLGASLPRTVLEYRTVDS